MLNYKNIISMIPRENLSDNDYIYKLRVDLRKILERIPIKNAINNWIETLDESKKDYFLKTINKAFFLTKTHVLFPITCLDEEELKGMIGYLKTVDNEIYSIYLEFCNFIKQETYGTIRPEEEIF
jgi:hypothetical protein